jgi:HK97 family phage major capsid protein
VSDSISDGRVCGEEPFCTRVQDGPDPSDHDPLIEGTNEARIFSVGGAVLRAFGHSYFGDTELDSLNKAKYAIIGDDFSPSFVLLNPADFGTIERLKDNDDGYVAGNGNAVGYLRNGLGPLVWDVPVILSNDMTEGSFIMADATALQLSIRQDAVVEMFEQNESDAKNNLILLRGEMRAAFSVFVPSAVRFGSLTV